MILVEIILDGVTRRLSTRQLYLEHQWDALLLKISPIHLAMQSDAGGQVKPVYGTIALFRTYRIPPETGTVKIMATDSTEAAAVTMLEGSLILDDFDDSSEVYRIQDASFDQVLDEDTLIDDDLEGVCTTYCGASYLNISTTDFSAGRATSPRVYGNFVEGTPIVDMLSALCEAQNHYFYIVNDTLYLGDMLLDNGDIMDVTEFDVEPLDYSMSPAHKAFYSEAAYKYRLAGSNAFGEKYTSSTAAPNIEHLYMRVGDNSGDDQSRMMHKSVFEYDPTKTYMMEIRYRVSSGSNTINAGFAGVAADRSTLVNINGIASDGSQHSFVISGGSSSSWAVKRGYASGNDTTGDSSEHPNVASPAVLHTDAVNFRLWINANVGAGSGEQDIDYVKLCEVDPSTGAILEEIYYEDFTRTWGQDWQRYTGSGNREQKTSRDESRTNVLTALGNLKTIIESRRAVVTLSKMSAANLPVPGQRLAWSDGSSVPDGEDALTSYIRARDIIFDLENEKIRIEGEGAIT